MRNIRKKFMSCALILSLVITSLVIFPAKAMAADQIKATVKAEDAPSIQINTKYKAAPYNDSHASEADILAWNSNDWNNFHYVKFEISVPTKIELYAEDTSSNNAWFELLNSSFGRETTLSGKVEPYVGTIRDNVPVMKEIYVVQQGTYYLGLQPHAPIYFSVNTVKAVTVEESSIELLKGKNTVINASVMNQDQVVEGAELSFESSNTDVAKVSSTGKVVAVNNGVCTITVSSENAESAEVTVIVKPGKIKKVAVATRTRNSIILKWSKQKKIAGCEVWMYDPDLEEYTKVKTTKGTATTAKIKNLRRSTTYKFKVRSFIKDGSKKYYSDFTRVYKFSTKK